MAHILSKNLVLVHGFLGSSMNWGPVLHRLKGSSWNLHAVDLLGHGARLLSDDTSLTLRKTSEDFATQVPFDRFVGLGHSFGLRPLLDFYSLYPDRLEALIVEDASPELSYEGYQFLRKIFDLTPVPFSSREEARQYFVATHGDTPMARFLLSQIREKEPEKYSWRFNATQLLALLEESFEYPLWSAWAEFPRPICLVTGANSTHMTKQRVQEAVQRRGNLPILHTQVANSAHWVHSENIDGFIEAIKQYLGILSSDR